MKRFLAVLALLALPLFYFGAPPAYAGRWSSAQELKWHQGYLVGTSLSFERDTIYSCPGGVDTTGFFSIGPLPMLPHAGTSQYSVSGTGTADTTLVGVVTVVSDSAFTGTANVTAIGYSVDVACGVCGDTYTRTTGASPRPISLIYSGSVAVKSGACTASIPIFAITGGATAGAADGGMFAPYMSGLYSYRVRLTSATGSTPWGRSRVYYSTLQATGGD